MKTIPVKAYGTDAPENDLKQFQIDRRTVLEQDVEIDILHDSDSISFLFPCPPDSHSLICFRFEFLSLRSPDDGINLAPKREFLWVCLPLTITLLLFFSANLGRSGEIVMCSCIAELAVNYVDSALTFASTGDLRLDLAFSFSIYQYLGKWNKKVFISTL